MVDTLVSVRATLRTTAEGIQALCEALEEPGLAGAVERAVELVLASRGRVIVSGIGKSGHIGRKIAATLASTGTPAYFVHPTEASHGDLGMIGTDDVILALSWSGETPEFAGILAYAKRFAVPLIALTATAESQLARSADAALVLPKVREACPHGLAPTTSTVLQLAMGDAIAIALLERRGFSATDFKVFHPGGKLGAQLLHVGEIAHGSDKLPLVAQGTAMGEALLVMSGKGFGTVGIVGEGGRLVGVITDGDLRRHMRPDLVSIPVDAVMSPHPRTVRAEMLAVAALEMVQSQKIGVLFVVDDEGRPTGIVHVLDLLRAGVA